MDVGVPHPLAGGCALSQGPGVSARRCRTHPRPVGGQGMIMGIQDAFNLAWKLSLVLRSGGRPQLLDSYEAERRPVDEAVSRQTDRTTRLVSLHGTVARFIRDHMMSLLTQIPAVAEKLGDGLSGLAVNY